MCPVIHAPGTKVSTACKNEESMIEKTTSVDRRTNALREMMSLTVLKWCRHTYNSKVATASSKWYLETRQNNGVWSRFFGWERYKWKIFLAEGLLAVAVWNSVLKTSHADAGRDLSSCLSHLSVVTSCLCLSPANAPAVAALAPRPFQRDWPLATPPPWMHVGLPSSTQGTLTNILALQGGQHSTPWIISRGFALHWDTLCMVI